MQPLLKTWAEVWQRAQSNECTHYNYSHGKIRFRGILEEPEEIGTEVHVEGVDRIRIRFFSIIEEEYVEHEELDCWLKIQTSALSMPDGFDGWDGEQQKNFINIQLERVSASRFSKQMDSADRMWHRFVQYLMTENTRKDKQIQELNNKLAEQAGSKGIMNLYEFLTHPNAERVVASLASIVTNALRSGGDRPKVNPQELLSQARALTGKPDPDSSEMT
ncbi:MAG: hypothetical protein JNJ46_23715 [Myxococcales bacterium]|nr:hypothetical protein [Myxococcales bacterium]